MKKTLVKISVAVLMASLVLALFGGLPAMADPAMPSTNNQNRINGWAHVDQTAVGVGSITLNFISTRPFYSCFEYRTDGDTSQILAENGGVNYGPGITDGLYPYTCRNNNTTSRTLTASEYVEVRTVFGAEGDERFNWTRFDVLPPPNIATSTDDALICTGETTDVYINLTDVVGLYGYQFQVSYDQTKASAAGAFVYSFFDVDGDGTVPPPVPPATSPWNAVCAGGSCSFARTELAPDPAVSGFGRLAKITLTGVAPGTFSMAISDDVLSDIDGIKIAHGLGAPLPITVCGLATISGNITLQGRPGNIVDAGTVTMIEQGSPTNFTPVAPANFTPTNGAYSIQVPYMPGGTNYKILAEHGVYLDNAVVFNVIGDATKSTRLWGGDANNDGMIDISDLTCIGSDFGTATNTCSGGSSDINADLTINIQDLALAGGNYTKTGEQVW